MKPRHAIFRRWCSCLGLLLAVITLGCGCSGIHATKSISPLDFIIPGLGMSGAEDEGLIQVGQGAGTPRDVAPEPSTS